MPLSAREYLLHILDEADYLALHTRGVTRERFLADETLRRAFVRSLEVIGEAAKQVPECLRNEHPEIEWRAMAGMRDRLIHGYFGVDYEIVWDAAANKVPRLAGQVRHLLQALNAEIGLS